MTTTAPQAPDRYAIALDCVHCGLCLPACPTYTHLGDEADSPRGRIYLMRAHDEGRQLATAAFRQHLDACLGCRACETACPSGVRFGAMLEDFRALLRAGTAPARGRAGLRAAVGRHILRQVVPSRRRLRLLANALYVVQATGLLQAARRLGLLRVLGVEALAALAPRVPSPAARRRPAEHFPAHGRRRARVLFLRGCVAPELLPGVQRASIAALRHNGCDVLVPGEQTCCGALHFHAGHTDRGLELLDRNTRAFDLRDVDALVVDAAGCGSTLKEYGRYAALRPAAAAARALAGRTRDIHEFLHDLGLVTPGHAVRARVAYDDPCHLLHGQRLAAPPRAVLAAVPGLETVPLADADRCCGSAGIYNLLQPALAAAVLDAKVRSIAASGADVVATGNPGCILQIAAGLRRAAASDPRLARVAVVHPMQLLARAYGEPA